MNPPVTHTAAPRAALDAPTATLDQVRSGLEDAAALLRAEGVPVPPLEGKLLRPLVAFALVPPSLRPRVDTRFWSGALAVQMVHEASLLHDDILDEATERRGHATMVASRGVGPALVLGDHYLTGAYRAAAAAEAPAFLTCFIRAVERTVAGEIAQERAMGRALSTDEYLRVVTGKSGELFGATTCLGGALFGLEAHDERVALGRDLGALYQQVDDLLDYCPETDTGKPPLQDYRQQKWTWMLGLAGLDGFRRSEEEVLTALFAGGPSGLSPARRGLAQLRARRDALVDRVTRLSPGDEVVARVVDAWLRAAEAGVSAQEKALPRPVAAVEEEVRSIAARVGGPAAWPDYFGKHAKTFRFASRLFPPGPAAQISGVYAFCRFTDDLVDDPRDGASPAVLEARLEAWAQLSRAAFEGEETGVPLLDVVLGEAGRAGVSWRYPDALLAGVAMDLTRTRYPDWDTLEEYTFGVAGAVGGWITQLFGIHDEALLARAHALGHGMQLTNIARDVGEDWGRGRLYLPLELLARHGLTEGDVELLRRSRGPLPRAYRDAVEELVARAEAYYEEAWPGIQALPAWYRRPVAVAAQAYRGIHREIRRNGHDNLRLRASTSASAKLVLAAAGLFRAHG